MDDALEIKLTLVAPATADAGPQRQVSRAPEKYKELIGVAIHAETKCRYCTLFHTEAARLFGATDEEIQEAVHFAKYTVGWSVYLNGMREDYDQFAKELQQIGQHLSATG